MQSTFSKRNTFGARTECPSYKQSNKGIRERKGPTVDVRFTEIPVLQKIPLRESRPYQRPGGVRHDPQRFMGKTVTVPHFNPDTVEFASRKRSESNQGIKTLLPFPKIITEDSDFENFQDLIVALDACYWVHKAISRSLSRFGEDRAIQPTLSGD